MNPMEVISEYLVKLSADVDTGSFNAAMSAINELTGALKKVKGLAVVGAAASGFVAIGKAALDTVKNVAAADMQFQRLANQMWVTKETAKSLSTAMKVMGVSEEDIAWIPELREQFFRLRGEMNALATPVDADRQLRWIRQIGYDVQSLQVKLKMLKEWVAYYLIKYLQPFIKEFQDFINWLNDKLGKNMPTIARRIAEILGHIVSIGLSAMKVVKMVLGAIYRFGESLPSNVKRWGAIFATVGAFILAGPFGKFIIALGGVLLLLEDFVYYMNGWKSSRTLAPVWEKLLQFLESDTLSHIGETVKEILSKAAEYLDLIIKKLGEIKNDFLEGIDWPGIKESWSKAIDELSKGIDDLWDELSKLFGTVDKNTDSTHRNRQKEFWHFVAHCISEAVKAVAELVISMGKLAQLIAAVRRGDWDTVKDIVMNSGLMKQLGLSPSAGSASLGADEAANAKVGMDYFVKNGFTPEGAAGAAGNISAESGWNPEAIEDTKGLPDGWLDRVRDGTISRDEFENYGGGFGILQWSDSRKGDLWDYAARNGLALNSLQTQLDFALYELRNKQYYSDVWDTVTHSHDVGESSNKWLHKMEAPLDSGPAVEAYRASLSQAAWEYYQQNQAAGDEEDSGATPAGSDSFIGTGSRNFMNSHAMGLIGGGYGYGSVPSSYSTTDSHNFTVGSINVNVASSNATPQEIGQGVRDALDAGFRGGWSI